MNKRFHIIVHGRVQGVFFRAETRTKARQLNLTGWVRNNSDGTVEIIAEGDTLNLLPFLKWCHEGPESARVEKLELKKQDYEGEFTDFGVRY